MRSIVRDLKEHCPECCEPEKTIEYLFAKGDISYTSDHYREVWFFYLDLCKEFRNKKLARESTMELFKIKVDKFKYIQRWAKRTGLTKG